MISTLKAMITATVQALGRRLFETARGIHLRQSLLPQAGMAGIINLAPVQSIRGMMVLKAMRLEMMIVHLLTRNEVLEQRLWEHV